MTARRLLSVPAPTDPHDFDAKVTDALRLREGNVRLIRYARHGQAQRGIDGWDSLSGPKGGIVWQAKLEQKSQLLRKLKKDLQLLDEAGFEPKLFILATGLARDGRIQDAVAEISTERQLHSLCPVEVLFWDEIREIILSDDKLFTKHYRELVVHETSTAKKDDTLTPPARAPKPPTRAPKPPAIAPEPSVESPLPLVVTEAASMMTNPNATYRKLWQMLHLAKMCSTLTRAQIEEIQTMLMTAEFGIQSHGKWASGKTTNYGENWKYPNGNSANHGENWRYPNGNSANHGENWHYPNGKSANHGSTWYTPDGNRAPTEDALMPMAIRGVDASQQRQVLAAIQRLSGQIRRLALIELVWISHNRRKL